MINIGFVLFGLKMVLLMSKSWIIIKKLEKRMIRVPTNRTPTHPGEMLLEEFLNPMGLTQKELADAILVPHQWINEIVNGRGGITPSTALRLGKFFNISPDFWMNIQLRWEMYFASKAEKNILKKISPVGSVTG
jgi:addiction module HigA family antidote